LDCRQGQEIDVLSEVSRTILGPTLPPIQCVPGEKRPEGEADLSAPFSAAVKIGWGYTSSSPHA
jgi:hypothetical protein